MHPNEVVRSENPVQCAGEVIIDPQITMPLAKALRETVTCPLEIALG
jgi:hypothetical protein